MRPHKIILAGLGLLLVLLVGFLFRPTFTPPVRGARAESSLEEVRLPRGEQTVLIRGQDQTKPILLFLHGGPGLPTMFLAHRFQRPLERDFLVVQWDRWGAGKSFHKEVDPRTMSTSGAVRDAEALLELLQRRYGKRPAVVVGHSYGSVVGLELARRRPDLVRAYVGVGQVACTRAEERRLQDAWLAGRAAAAGDEHTLALARTGGEWDRGHAIARYGGAFRDGESVLDLLAIGLTAPEYNGLDLLNVVRGRMLRRRVFAYDGPPPPLWRSAATSPTPVHLFVGRHDHVTPGACAERYFQALRAPAKSLVHFADSAHYPFLEEPERFRQELLKIAGPRGEGPQTSHAKIHGG